MENPPSDNQRDRLRMIEDASKGLDDVAAGRVHDARAVLDEIADQRYARILAGEKTIPWAEMKSALIARLESAKTSEKCEGYDAYLHGKVTIAREQIGRGEYSSSESVEATFTERHAKISNQVLGDEPPASCAE